jgi:hypothetical protein
MRNLISIEEKNRIDSICSRFYIRHYTINADGSIDVDDDVNLEHKRLTQLPLRFGNVTGRFSCSMNILTTLEGSPHTVGDDYHCSINMLTSLEGSPTSVGGNFRCGHNGLTSLVGAPHSVGSNLYCSNNKLTSTYSGDTDIEASGIVRCNMNILPQQLKNNVHHIKLILKYQRHFFIWNDDLTLNEENFQNLIAEIEDGLE